jgi:hypothetical protein
MQFIVPDPDDIIPGPIDSGHHVGCTVEGCAGLAAVLWVDTFDPWISILCAEHGQESLPSAAAIANPVFFDSCPAAVRQAAVERVKVLRRNAAKQKAE